MEGLDQRTSEGAAAVIGQPSPGIVAPPARFWDEARTESLKLLWASGKSALIIAAELGTTRGAVIGKVDRLQLPHRTTRFAFTKAMPRKRSAPRERGQPAQPKPAHRLVADMAAPPSLDLTIDDLGKLQCHYPYGNEAPYTFCGHAVSVAGAPYCCAHMQLCYGARE